jgi:hypothetical protein
LAASAQGHSGFASFVERNWETARRAGWKLAGAGPATPVDYLVCVADADRAEECCAAAGPAPAAPNSTAAWVENAGALWTAQLRAATRIGPDRVHGRFLRWNLESVLAALFDLPNALRQLAHFDADALDAFVAACVPDPRNLPSPGSFVDHFRDSRKCLGDMVTAARAHPRVLSRSSPGRVFALDEAATDGPALQLLLERIPDLRATAALLDSFG